MFGGGTPEPRQALFARFHANRITIMPLRTLFASATLALLVAPVAQAQDHRAGARDPVALRHADSRQYRGEPAGNARDRGQRCRNVRVHGRLTHVCPRPTRGGRAH
jgi:hypothetical protein